MPFGSRLLVPTLAASALLLAACSSSSASDAAGSGLPADWAEVARQAQGQTVSLWMWGGDPQANAYVDDVLAPAVKQEGVTLKRVPVADTQDALNRILSEQQAGRADDGAVDLVWVNGENFRTGQQSSAWLCDWTRLLPNMGLTDPDDDVLTSDFGVPVQGCEAPWHKAQFTLVYDSADIQAADVPTTFKELDEWIAANPGRFTYPAPPDFTGSAFVRQALVEFSDIDSSATELDDQAVNDLMERLERWAPNLWREGATYPKDSAQLDRLFADDQVSFTMTYGPATLDALVDKGTFPDTTRVLPLEGGTLGNASFLAIPANAGSIEGAMVVADVALSAEQQAAKADPGVWGQFTVLALDRLAAGDRARFEALPASEVVPPFDVLSRDADAELPSAWVPVLERAWRSTVLR
jgi:putative spermidine/putrescine transport system substrate-binding protein